MCAETKKSYNFLYGQSYLLSLGIKLEFLDEFESLFIVKSKNRIQVKRDYRFQTQCIIDISEKMGFLYLALDYIKLLAFNERLIKYHLYNFVYNCKVCLDSMAVLLNYQLNLGFKGGKRDFRIVEFRRALENKSVCLKDFSKKFGRWCDAIIEFRDRIIHRIGVPIFKTAAGHPVEEWKPALPLCIPKKAISLIDLIDKKVEVIEIITFCKDNVEIMMNIAKIALSEIYKNVKNN